MSGSSFMTPPRRGPRSSVVVLGVVLVGGLCWVLWPDPAQGTPGLSVVAPSEQPDPQPQAPQDQSSDAPSDSPGRASPEAAEEAAPEPSLPADPLARAREELEALRKAGDGEALRRRLCTFVLDPRLDQGERASLLREADALNARLIWSATPGPCFDVVRVQPNDSYWKIARRVNRDREVPVTAGMLEAINKVRPQRLRLGQALKVPKEAVTVLVDKSSFTLYVLLGGTYVRRFPVGIGKDSSTPEGTFTVRGKTAKPVWTDPKTGRRFRYGEEGHLVGSRWMGFWQGGGPTGYGIHGTIEPESVGKAVSDGCIRLTNADVEALFELVPEGASVAVRP